MAQNAQKKQSRHHATFLAATVRGASIEALAKEAGVHRRTVTRWVAAHQAEIAEARASLVSDALTELRAGLLSATRRLVHEVEDFDNGAAGISAARALLAAHHDLALVADYGARLDAVEKRLEGRGR
jgi:hypothetical protein